MIGQSNNIPLRWSNYKYLLRNNKYDNSYLQRSWNRYGEKNFEFKIITLCPINKLDTIEKLWIKKYDATNRKKGYNIEAGGNRNKHCAEETKQKMRKAQLGNKNHFFGKHHSKETRRKMCLMRKGRIVSRKTRQKLRNAFQNMSKRAKLKWRKAIRLSMLGRHHSKETKRKMSIARTKYFAKKKQNKS